MADPRRQATPAEVRNAADANQVKRAAKNEQLREEERRAFYQEVLETVAGRAVFWDLLSRAGMFRSIFDPQGSRLYYNTGRQDFGHEIAALLVEQDERLYIAMETEARRRAKIESDQMAAAHTPRAEESETSSDG